MDIFPSTYTATAFLGDAGTAVGTTVTNVAPLIAGLAGLALAIVLVPRIISWVRHAGGKGSSK